MGSVSTLDKSQNAKHRDLYISDQQMTVYKNRFTQARSFSRRLPVLDHSLKPWSCLFSSTFHFTGSVLLLNKTIITSLEPSVKPFWLKWCRLSDSNWPHPPYKSGALPNELNRHYWWRWQGSNLLHPACKAGALPNELHPRVFYLSPTGPVGRFSLLGWIAAANSAWIIMFLNWLRWSAVAPFIRATIRLVVLLNLNVLPGFIIYLLVNLAESQGVEPCDPFYLIYGLANRCITILPTLVILWKIFLSLTNST